MKIRDYQVRMRIIVAALAALLMADGTLAYLGYKLAEERANPQQILTMQQRQLQLLKADVQRATVIKNNVPEVLKGFDEFEKSLPPASKGYSVISQELGEYALQTHALVEDLKFKQKELAGRNLNELEIEATVSGDYTGIVKFLNDLQRSTKNQYVVDSLALDAQNNAQGPPGALRVSLHMRTYFRKA